MLFLYNQLHYFKKELFKRGCMNINSYSKLKNTVLLFLASMVSGVIANAQTYCTPTYTNQCSSGYFIQSFATSGGVTNITNNNTGCGSTTTSYSDYTGVSGMIHYGNAGDNVGWTIKNGSNQPNGFAIFVDWNQDGVFNPAQYTPGGSGELMTHPSNTYATSGGANVTNSFPIPMLAKNGVTRMRVRAGSYGVIHVPNMDACTNYDYGETEDYLIEVNNPCVEPESMSFSNIDFRSAEITWTARQNARLYEYVVTKTKGTPNSGTLTANRIVSLNNLQCDSTYYVYVRVACDTSGPPSGWFYSPWLLDSFKTDPCCLPPQVTLEQITSTSVIARWQPIPSAYSYEYAISTINQPPQKGTYTQYTSAFFPGLQSNTHYYVFVRSRCSPTPLSDWHGIDFTTKWYLTVDGVENEAIQLSAYPNPTQSNITINVGGDIKSNANVVMTDITGKVVYTTPVTSEKVFIDMSNMPVGIYVVKYTDDLNNGVIRIMKQ